MRSGQEIEEATRILETFEHAHPGLKTQLTLYTDGEGAILIQNNRLETVDGVDFTENASLVTVTQALVERVGQVT